MKSNVGSSNAGSYRITKENLAMEKDLETKKLSNTVRNENTQLRQRMEEKLNLLREQTNLQPLKFSTLKESLLRDLKNRFFIDF
ncbi:hypothetical protein DICPUDRAFT_158177 [Dictyostelium purpureum]|uniref:Uncharacterized protein n=1 Tax=Dictyostelium purpureum TaxID=5786 RepID=F1A108_DICPU|nr:uncharacterized protein DICPUDRAFT_158177 [Dictyostelium purpureum]EGC30118.1 hypothetical protein DICPUDRAFT_158177 [Dictyostelium purpureum]|eukprot:XP_003293350.1 hypothetical protein DICPUDRAFT_158177 [Dictyostelium purpureum]